MSKQENPIQATNYGLKIPLMPHRTSKTFKTENGIYYESDTINGLTFYINRQKGHIGIFDRKSGILEVDFDRLPDFISELLDEEDQCSDLRDQQAVSHTKSSQKN